MASDQGYEESSGNIFADLGLDNAEELGLRSSLAIELRRTLKSQGLTQRMAAAQLNTTQPTLSKVLRGDIDRVSLETLFAWLRLLGKRVEYRICDARGNNAQAVWREAR
ncbi:transcriptional regulator [Desulfovibrio sp. DV]|uniref:helix-turn-helix domain-containing protein n=1 Tax=Desulfovibrio sp. DV TaxID=1844708 RepID=UPI00094B8BDF|nr:helix-turn-helix transcriptional regulator [Desulfovibrio sp. DV]OLN30869.1 transcriptional regulator [Desulfovibrio sp. DV]